MVFFLFFRYKIYFDESELQKVKDFLADETKTVEDYQELIRHYHDTECKVIYENEATVWTTLFEINQKKFFESISNVAQSIKNTLLDELIVQYQAIAKGYLFIHFFF